MTCGNSTEGSREKMFLQKLVLDIWFRCYRILKECWMLAQEMSNNLKRVCDNYEFFKTHIN